MSSGEYFDDDGAGYDYPYGESGQSTIRWGSDSGGIFAPTEDMETMLQRSMAEFVGSMIYVFAGSASVSNELSLSIAFAHGLVQTSLMVIFGNISGGHFNPALSLAAMFCKVISPILFVLYFIAQLFGAIAGAGICRCILWYPTPDSANQMSEYVSVGGGANTLAPGVSPICGMVCESVTTALVTLAYLMSAVDCEQKSDLSPIAVGAAVTVGILAGYGVTGASMNPTRSVGTAMLISHEKTDVWRDHYVYWVGPFLGSLIGTLFYRLFFCEESQRLLRLDGGGGGVGGDDDYEGMEEMDDYEEEEEEEE